MSLSHIGLFEGYGGTSMAAARVLGELNTLWVSDVKPAACTLLDYRRPDVPNLGDMTQIDYMEQSPVDVLTASWPCQPHSSAGKRLGEADPRALWPHVARAVGHLRPAVFLGENVARITSNGELRRVVRSLAELGYVGAWRVLGASDVYAPHRRLRCFVAAIDASTDPAAHTEPLGRIGGSDRQGAGRASSVGVLPTDHPGDSHRAPGHLTLLPTPTQSMTTGAGTSGREGGLNLQTAALTLLPTPTAQAYGTNQGGAAGRTGIVRESLDTMARNDRLVEWGPYAEAIARWGACFDREAPNPTQPSDRTGKPQLAPAFVEWMMGLPQGHVTAVPGLSRNQQLSLLGDGVVPQQGAAAFTFLLDHLAQRLAVAA